MFTLRQLTSMFSSFIIIFSLTFSAFQPISVSAQGEDGVERQINAESGRVSFINPESGRVISAARVLGTSLRPQNPALALAKRFGPEFGLKNPANELSEIKTDLPKDGRMVVHYQQNYQGIPVMGGELVVNTNRNGDLYSMNGEVSPDLALQTQPNIDSAQARDSALQAMAKWYQMTPADFTASDPELWIFDESLLQPSTRAVELVWRMEVISIDNSLPVRELVLVNAQKGGISLHFNQIDTAWVSSKIEPVPQAQDVTPTETPIPTNTPVPTETPLPTETPVPSETPIPTETSLPTEQPASFEALSSESDVSLLAVTLYVKASGGSNSNDCLSVALACATINGAIGKAASGDTIRVTTGTFIGTGNEVAFINKSVTISGGWNSAFTTQSGMSTIDGQDARRGITVSIGTVTIDHFSITNGFNEDQGGGIYNSSALTINNTTISGNKGGTSGLNAGTGHGGGGIYNSGTLTINNTTVSGNGAGDPSFGVGGNYGGGGILNYFGNVTLNNSLVSGNMLLGLVPGSGINTFLGTLTLNNSTVSSNLGGYGEGIRSSSTNIVLNNSTISNNESEGIFTNGIVTLQNTIIAGNSNTKGDCRNDGGTFNSQGYNLIGSKPAECTFNSTTGDLVGTSVNPIDSRLTPLHLTPLQDNGGSTFTHALMVGSPAINAGNPAAPGSGGNVCLGTDQHGTTRPVDSRCDIGAYEGSVPYITVSASLINTYTANSTSSLPGNLLCNESQPNCTNGSNPHADAAHKYAIGAYNLYLAQFNRDSIDNNGMVITSSVHYCGPTECPYENANWTGSQMIYGDASGYPLADDVVAHELTHGVTQYESDLFYYYQSGAINESFSDVFGEYYDQSNGLGNDTSGVKWLMGEDVTGMGVLRSMSNPPAYGDPDKMTSSLYMKDADDNGGVHYNSGVNNKAAYLMVDGGTFNGKTVTALGWVKTAAIYYEVQTNLLSSGADYSDLYYALQQACTNLIGQKGITSGNCLEVKDAVDAVEMNLQPVPNFNTNITACDVAGGHAVYSFYDDLEAGSANWVHGATIGTDRWTYDSIYDSYAHSGQHYMYADDWPTEPTDTYLRMATSIKVPPNGHMLFHHAYDFEVDYDGGVLEYSKNAGSSWIDAGSLIDGNGYDETLSTISGNPLGGRLAFNGISHGYISTRLNLSSLVGQNIMFRFRMGLDEAAYAGGWWLDDVQVYECTDSITYVVSSTPANNTYTNAANVNFTVTFSDAVTGVNTIAPFSDFMLTTTGVTGAFITAVTGMGATRTVAVNTGTGSGTIRLDVLDNDNIINEGEDKLGGIGLHNGDFNSGGIYTIDKTSPTVLSIMRANASPSAAASVSFNVTFSESVSGVDIGDFTLSSTDVVGATVSGVIGSGATRVIQVKTGTADGTIRLNLMDNNTIIDSATNLLGGVGAGNGNFTTGETYTIDKPGLRAPILRSPQSKVSLKNSIPSFWWTGVQGAQSYEIQFARNNSFTASVVSEIVNGLQYNVTIPLSDGAYYWRVRAYNISNQPGIWSSYRILTIDTTGPSAPVLNSPTNNSSTWRVPIFKWQKTNSTISYQFQYDNNFDFSSPIYTIATRGNFRRPPAMKIGTYYWRVRAKDAVGNWGVWSAPRIINIIGR